jgi:hypothetical protein
LGFRITKKKVGITKNEVGITKIKYDIFENKALAPIRFRPLKFRKDIRIKHVYCKACSMINTYSHLYKESSSQEGRYPTLGITKNEVGITKIKYDIFKNKTLAPIRFRI